MQVIIIVEEIVIVSMALETMLTEAGYEVIAAANANGAIRLLESRSDIRFVVTSADLSGDMDGARLAAAVRLRWPPVDIVILTSDRRTISEVDERVEIVSIPYAANTLLSALARFG